MKTYNTSSSVHNVTLTALLSALFLLFFQGNALAVTKAEADGEYKKGNYQQAIIDYKALLGNGVSPELYYNLGNAYYRTDSLTHAILCYERAALLAPGDADIRFNLQFARSKTIDKITPQSDNFLVNWYHGVVNFTSVDNWARFGVVSLVLALVLLLAYFFDRNIAIRKVGFFGGIALTVAFALSVLFAWQQKYSLENRKGAIVVTPSLSIKKTPSANGEDDFVLHEGTRVDITDSLKDWREIHVGDGRQGWVKANAIEKI